MDHFNENLFTALEISEDEYHKILNEFLQNWEDGNIQSAIDYLNQLENDNKFKIISTILTQTTYNKLRKTIEISDDDHPLNELFGILTAFSLITEDDNKEIAERGKASLIFLSICLLSSLKLPISLIVEIIIKCLNYLDIDIENEIFGAFAFMDILQKPEMFSTKNQELKTKFTKFH